MERERQGHTGVAFALLFLNGSDWKTAMVSQLADSVRDAKRADTVAEQ